MKKTALFLILALLTFAAVNAAEPVKILAIGNSFTVDAVQEDLVPLAAADGIEIVVGYPYRGGTTLEQHRMFAAADSAVYDYRKNVGGNVTHRRGSTLDHAIADEDWDWVVLQPYYHKTGLADDLTPHLAELMAYVKSKVKSPDKVRFALYMPWSFAKNSTHKLFKAFDKDQQKMYDAVRRAIPVAAKEAGIDVIIPAGTAVQNLRTTFYGDNCNRDGYHMHLDHGRYTVGCTWYETLFGRPVSGIAYRPKELSPYQASACQTAAHCAVQHPFEVTDLDGIYSADPLLEYFKGRMPEKYQVGTTIGPLGGLDNLTYKTLNKLKYSGLDCIEISLTNLVNGDNPMPLPELKKRFMKVKEDADRAGIQVRSIHMPYDFDSEISYPDEKKRKENLKRVRKYLDVVSVLKPEYILFHPAGQPGVIHGRRQEHIAAVVKSVKELNPVVKKMGAHILIENLRGPHLMRKNGYERGLGRTVDEMVQIMSMMPDDVYVCVDLNHITEPEKLIMAVGPRIRSLHVCDSDGERDRHWLPGKGKNDWPAIIEALYKVGYKGPWLYEIKAEELDGSSVYAIMPTLYNWCYRSYLEQMRRREEAEKYK